MELGGIGIDKMELTPCLVPNNATYNICLSISVGIPTPSADMLALSATITPGRAASLRCFAPLTGTPWPKGEGRDRH